MANLIDTIQAEGTSTTFTRALKMSELVTALREPGAYTVFAPNDAAFAQMRDEMREELLGNYYNLSRVVSMELTCCYS